MSKNIQKVFLTVLEYIPISLTIFFSVFIAYKAQFTEMSTNSLLGWILGILAGLAVSILVDRFSKLKRIENQTNELTDLLKNKEGKTSIKEVLSTRRMLKPLEDRLQSSKEIIITGGSLFRLSSEYVGLFESLLKDGCNIKLLMLNPESNSAKLTAENIVYEIGDFESYKNHINSSLKNFGKLKEKYPENLSIRTSDFLPSFSLFGIDVTKPNGNIMVELYTHDVPTRERPHFNLLQQREPFWFEFFHKQFQKVWGKSVEFIP